MSQPFFSAETSFGLLPSARSAAITASMASRSTAARAAGSSEKPNDLGASAGAAPRIEQALGDHERRALQDRRQRRDLAFTLQFRLPLVQPLDQSLGGRFGVGGVDTLLLAGALLLAEPRRSGIPVVDLAV